MQKQEYSTPINHPMIVAETEQEPIERQPWQPPTVTSLAIKRTMNGSGTAADGGAGSTVV